MKKLLALVCLVCMLLFVAAFAEEEVKIDVDLTQLSSTMIYSEVYNIMMDPKPYLGKVIRVEGIYQNEYYPPTEQYYHFVLIPDATACCQQGIEFAWNGEHVFPDDYPEKNTWIEVTGVFNSYLEDGYTYYNLLVDDIVVN